MIPNIIYLSLLAKWIDWIEILVQLQVDVDPRKKIFNFVYILRHMPISFNK